MQSFAEFVSQSDEKDILATAPCRADLAGGTIDIWPLYLFHPGAVSVNIALGILTACKITPQDETESCSNRTTPDAKERFANLDELMAADILRASAGGVPGSFLSTGRRIRAGDALRVACRRRYLWFVGADDCDHCRTGPVYGSADRT